MRYPALALIALCCAAWAGDLSAVQMRAFQFGSWEGAAYYRDDTGAVSVCSMSMQYGNGVRLSITLQPAGGWALLLVKPEGFANHPVQYELYADGKVIQSGQRAPESGGQLLRIDLPFSKEGQQSFQRGTELRVTSGYSKAAFSLKGSADAIMELRRCVNGEVRSPSGPAYAKDQNRFDGQKTAKKVEGETPHVVAREKLIPYATEILQSAGLADYRFLPEGAGETSNALAWQFEDGSLGSLAAVEKAGSLDLDRFIGEITAEDTTSCKGEFANGKRAPHYVNGVEIRKVFASCNAGPKSFYSEYALVRMPNGFLVKLTSVKAGVSTVFGKGAPGSQDERDRITRTEEAALATLSRR